MKSNLLLSALLVASTAIIVPQATGQSASSAVKEMVKRDAKIDLSKVDTRSTGSIKTKDNFDARGVVIPNAEITLGAGVAAKIKNMPFKSGEAFRKGEDLVVFDCGRQLADLRGAKANLGKATSFYQGKRRLKSRGAAGGQEVREAAADVASATAAVDGLTEVIAYCKISAPFNGRVVERHAETHEIPAANAPIMTVVDDSALELDLIVPSSWLRWVKKGTTFDFAVDEVGTTFRAKVARLGAKVDAVSQTIKLTGTFVIRPDNVLTGMSGTAKFAPPTN